jgi:hypothetical protein
LEEAKEPIWIRRADVCFGSLGDISGTCRHVRFAPDSDRKSGHAGCRLSAKNYHSHRSESSVLFNYLIGGEHQLGRYFEAERLSGLKIDHKLELGWLRDR